MTACPMCGIEPTCTCNVFTPTPGPCRAHPGLRRFQEPVYFERDVSPPPRDYPKSIDRALFDRFMAQPDSRSGELQ